MGRIVNWTKRISEIVEMDKEGRVINKKMIETPDPERPRGVTYAPGKVQ